MTDIRKLSDLEIIDTLSSMDYVLVLDDNALPASQDKLAAMSQVQDLLRPFAVTAEAARDAALDYRNTAEQYRDGAVSAQQSASSSATDAASDRARAETAASNAESSETAAASSASSASSDAMAAASSATSASNDASAASSAAATATTQASNASDSADAAALSESNAADSTASASSDERSASSSASAANASEAAALNSENAASDSANSAASDAAAASNSADAAAASETAAGTSESNAAASEIAASDSEDMAEQWASAGEDVEVEPGLYSAYHWAKKAEDRVITGVSWGDVSGKPDFGPAATAAAPGTGKVVRESDAKEVVLSTKPEYYSGSGNRDFDLDQVQWGQSALVSNKKLLTTKPLPFSAIFYYVENHRQYSSSAIIQMVWEYQGNRFCWRSLRGGHTPPDWAMDYTTENTDVDPSGFVRASGNAEVATKADIDDINTILDNINGEQP